MMGYPDTKLFLFYYMLNEKHIVMRYYKFNKDRSLNPLQKRIKSCKKLGYLAKRNNLHMLDSFYFENQTWGALHKAWKGYVIAKNKDEHILIE